MTATMIPERAWGTTMARFVNMLLGMWLASSAFLWPHSAAERANAVIAGALCVLFAAIALRVPLARWLNAALAVWLFVSAWALPRTSVGSASNRGVIALAIFLMALVPNDVEHGVADRRAVA